MRIDLGFEANDSPASRQMRRALDQNLVAKRFAVEAYSQLVALGEKYDRATLRLVKVALAVEQEHAEILTTLIEDLKKP